MITETEFYKVLDRLEDTLRSIKIAVEDLDEPKGYFTKIKGLTKGVNKEVFWLTDTLESEVSDVRGTAEGGMELIDEVRAYSKYPDLHQAPDLSPDIDEEQ